MLVKIKIQNDDFSENEILINTKYIRMIERTFFPGKNRTVIAGCMLTYQLIKKEVRVYKVTEMPKQIMELFKQITLPENQLEFLKEFMELIRNIRTR